MEQLRGFLKMKMLEKGRELGGWISHGWICVVGA